MKKIIITGCSGSIGSYLINFYRKKNYTVIGIDQINPEKTNFDFYKVNMSNEKQLKKIYKKISSK